VSQPAPLSREDVVKVAALARLELSDEEIERFTGQLGSILGHAADLAALDLSATKTTDHPLELTNVLRADEVRPSLDRQEVLDQAPATAADRFLVPRILGEEP
jgi:aspartyl-tRNA(Asn)/glutamyl-tRNA(Gln) amidotransferase subunit C